MTSVERQLIAECGEFCHVTTLDRAESIAAGGLEPSLDESVVIRGPRRPQAVYLAPLSKLQTALEFVGDRARDQERLVVFQLAATVLAEKNCGPDYGWLAAHLTGNELESATITKSLQLGGLACYDVILFSEFHGQDVVPNPRYDGAQLV